MLVLLENDMNTNSSAKTNSDALKKRKLEQGSEQLKQPDDSNHHLSPILEAGLPIIQQNVLIQGTHFASQFGHTAQSYVGNRQAESSIHDPIPSPFQFRAADLLRPNNRINLNPNRASTTDDLALENKNSVRFYYNLGVEYFKLMHRKSIAMTHHDQVESKSPQSSSVSELQQTEVVDDEIQSQSKTTIKVESSVGLYDLPDEVLLPLMIHLDGSTLLNMTRVCKRFEAIAKGAFSKKYTGCGGQRNDDGFFSVEVNGDNITADIVKYHPYFVTFGANMVAIRVYFYHSKIVDQNHWLINHLRIWCTQLTHMKIELTYNSVTQQCTAAEIVNVNKFMHAVPTLSHLYLENMTLNGSWHRHSYPALKCFSVQDVYWTENNLIGFIEKNPQLQLLYLHQYDQTLRNLNILFSFHNKLPKLKTLSISFHKACFVPQSGPIKLESLETFKWATDSDIFGFPFYDAMSPCKNLQVIDVQIGLYTDEFKVTALQHFEQLKSLEISSQNMPSAEFLQGLSKLANLSELVLNECREGDYGVVMNIIRLLGTKLSLLKTGAVKWAKLSNDFVVQLAEFSKRNKHVKILLESYRGPFRQLVAHNGEVRCDKVWMYYDGYDPNQSKSATNLLDLNEKCFQKIVSFLSPTDQCALFNTCKRTQRAVTAEISQNILCVGYPKGWLEETVFESMGELIQRVEVENRNLSLDTWRNYEIDAYDFYVYLNQYCPNLVEMTTFNIDAHINDIFDYPWPKLRKIKISTCDSDGYDNLCIFDCPNLTHLDIGFFELSDPPMRLDHNNCFEHLTVLKFGCYNDSVSSFLMGLDDEICQQMQELMLSNITETNRTRWNQIGKEASSTGNLDRLIMRFTNLSTLRLLVRNVENCNTRLIFENCTKLIHLSIALNDPSDFMLDCVKTNCKHIKSIGIVVLKENNAFKRSFLSKVYKMFPKDVIELFYINSYDIFPITIDLAKEVPSYLKSNY